MNLIENYTKKHDFLVCIDSDGTAMDAMTVKHVKAFGPCFVKEFSLHSCEKEALALWNQINLYSATRGKNRFVTLLIILEKLNGKYLDIKELDTYKEWVNAAPELSNRCLTEENKKTGSALLKKVLNWSIETNKEIDALTHDDKKPFSGVVEFLKYAQDKADIAVVSSAGYDAIYGEWEHHDMLKFLSAMATQEVGSKKECIAKFITKGYPAKKVIKIGDAPPDLAAAEANGVCFYPIIAGQEEQCWQELKGIYFPQFLAGQYKVSQKKLIDRFNNCYR